MIEIVFAALPLGRPKARSLRALAADLQLSPSKMREVLIVLASEGRAIMTRQRRGLGYRNLYWRTETIAPRHGPADRSPGVKDWLPIETMPIGRPVLVKTTTGRERLAKRATYARVKHRHRGASVSCASIDPRGDVTATGWRED